MDEGTKGADFFGFLALDSTRPSAEPYLGGCLGDNFFFAMDFLREDRVDFEAGSAGAVPLLTAGV